MNLRRKRGWILVLFLLLVLVSGVGALYVAMTAPLREVGDLAETSSTPVAVETVKSTPTGGGALSDYVAEGV